MKLTYLSDYGGYGEFVDKTNRRFFTEIITEQNPLFYNFNDLHVGKWYNNLAWEKSVDSEYLDVLDITAVH